jgi:molybdenum cofactor biosynthesis enzyme MoaA
MARVQDYLSAKDTKNLKQVHVSMDSTIKEELTKLSRKNKLSLNSTIVRLLAYGLDSHRKNI